MLQNTFDVLKPPKMPKENIKSFTIRDARYDDIDKFNEIKDRKRLTAGGLFELLLIDPAQVNTNTGNENTEKINALQDQIKAALIEREELTTLNQNLTLQIEELNAKEPKTIQIEKKLTGTQFVLEPSDELAKKMHRCILYNIKQGKMNKVSQDLPAQFAKKAIEYFIKNEYNHILK